MIIYLTGDATEPVGDGNKIIAHICNNIGKWGKGFVVPLGKKYPAARESYLNMPHYELGQVDFIQATKDIMIANMIAQEGIYPIAGVPPIRYNALSLCLTRISIPAIKMKASVHMPRIGCGLAKGDWRIVEELINFYMDDVDVYVYDLPKK